MRGPQLLKAWREGANRKQTECAALVGVKQSTWSDWEAGRKSPQIKYAGRIEELSDGAVPVMAWTDGLEGARKERDSGTQLPSSPDDTGTTRAVDADTADEILKASNA